MTRKRLFEKPAGESKVFWRGNNHHGTTGEILCGLCGTNHAEVSPNNDEHSSFTLLGKQGVMECCGRAVDLIYSEWGKDFMEQLLHEFMRDPLNEKFLVLKLGLKEAAEAWDEAIKESAVPQI